MRIISATVAVSLIVAGCAGRTANPVAEYRMGDETRSCESIKVELSQIEADIARLVPETDKTGKNVALGVTGVFLIVPFFFMDLSDAEKAEVEAYRRRYNRLTQIGVEKGCTAPPAPPVTQQVSAPPPKAVDIKAVWQKGQKDSKYEPVAYRKDVCGDWMRFDQHGKKGDYGWEYDLIVPPAQGGAQTLDNLRPMWWRNKERRNGAYPWNC